MRLISIVGARPQFVKLAAICQAVGARKGVVHKIIHTGQHYDPALSAVFFEELGIPQPDYNLGVGSGPHGEQTGEMLKRLEPLLAAENPDWVLLYGDTNSTLAGALAASKLLIRSAHIEAGLRSYCRSMPEEVNRIVADHLSDLLLCPTELAAENLGHEGLRERVVVTGDVMYDASLRYRGAAESRGGALAECWRAGEFALATAHRAENTDNPERLRSIVRALDTIARRICPVVWPLHPRTKKRLGEIRCATGAITLIDPTSYCEMLLLEGRARFILTDSGGVQKEAYFFKVPCITLRDETEWVETLGNRCNVLAGAQTESIIAAAENVKRAGPWMVIYGNGDAGGAIVEALELNRAGARAEITPAAKHCGGTSSQLGFRNQQNARGFTNAPLKDQ
jgi:UDP-GlcNAc3NAcA epimerase